MDSKYNLPRKVALKRQLCSGSWTRELVVGKIKHIEEIDLLKKHGILIHPLNDILVEMSSKKMNLIKAAAGADLFNLMLLKK